MLNHSALRSLVRTLLTALALGCLLVASDPVLGAVEDPTYTALRGALPDGRQIPVTSPLILERDVFRFEFSSGTFHLLAPVAGRTVGAVFLGEGSYRLSPATEAERRHLAFLRGEQNLETLGDRFDTLVLLFADDTAQELALGAPIEEGQPEGRAVRALEQAQEWEKIEFQTNFYLRLLRDLLDTPGLMSGVFMALVDGRDLAPALIAVDPQGAEALGLASLLGGEDSILYETSDVEGGVWYLCHRAAEVRRGRGEPYQSPLDALHYEIDTTIEKNEDLAGTTLIRLRTRSALRVIPLHLVNSLEISEAVYRLAGAEEWTPVPFIQESNPFNFSGVTTGVGVVLPEPIPAGTQLEVLLTYRGDKVLFDTGQELFAVGARASWYPNAGTFTDPATFDLTYRVPKRKEVVSVGRKVGAETAERQEISHFKAEEPIRVAGFNFGAFNSTSQIDQVSGLRIDVYSNQRAVELGGRSLGSEVAETLVGPDSLGAVAVGPSQSAGRQNVSELAMVDGLNSARLFTTYFGPLPQDHVALTQQVQFSFGQSWPSLVFLPYASFLTGTALNAIGASFMQDFVGTVGYHEMAHQWWGHHVGWESYRDQWLSEGFAQFSALLAVQHTEGWEEHDRLWKEAQKLIVSKVQSSRPIYETGPLTQGWRLSNGRSKAGYQVLVYHKGAFVLHMLRMMMWDPSSPEPDRAFIAMMRDFTSTWAGKSPSTEDFKAVVKRHMVPAMNATGDGEIDWFFDQWVYGTEIPKLTSKLTVAKAGKDEYQISGEVALGEISESFRALVPLYVDFGKGRLAMVGRIPFTGPGSRRVDFKIKLPERPRKVLANAHWDILARD